MDKKQLLQQWKSSLVGVAQRDEALALNETEIRF
jgi:hypothetical protein